MNEDVIADLKQFIAITVSQQTTILTGRLNGLDGRMDSLDARMNGLEKKVDDIQVSIGEALATANDAADTQLQDHERRIVALEHTTT